jgi:tRNA threonylcarbamoyladenosine biosynthesis protein TsaE
MKTKQTHSPQETEQLAFELGLLLKDEERVLILLDGELGAGKTTFAKGLARALEIEEIVNSPTFTIMKKYDTPDYRRTLYHLDLYRLNEVGDDFDLEEYIDGDGMIVIEWPHRVDALLPDDYLLVEFDKIAENIREVRMTCVGYPCKRAVRLI